VNDSLKNTALKALKELIYGILQYAVFVVAIPLLMREVD